MTDKVQKRYLDLYCLQKNGEWRFVNSGRPNGKTNQATIIVNMQPGRERICALSSSLRRFWFPYL
ncbi:hypothetical protein NXW94_30170 [Bacteroides ovatus]|nr:hypothetical protein [Bacteroides ovatus]